MFSQRVFLLWQEECHSRNPECFREVGNPSVKPWERFRPSRNDNQTAIILIYGQTLLIQRVFSLTPGKMSHY